MAGKEGSAMKDRLAQHLYQVCEALFTGPTMLESRIRYWLDVFTLDTILYALLEARHKLDRAPQMTAENIADFAEVVMKRKARQEVIYI